MALNYIGNPDFRGYLAYLAKNGDGRADLAINGYGTGYVDNEGKINRGLLNELNQSAPGGPSDESLQKAQIDYLASKYNQFQGAANPQYAPGGGSAGTAQDSADEAAYWEDQMANADSQLARLGKQRETGNENINNSYNSAYNRLVGDKETTNRDYTTKRTQTTEDNITAKGNIDTSVRNRNTGLQRLLGSRGAGNSSAAQILAPYAAAREGSQQRTQVSQAFGRNMQGLDTAWGDYEKDWNTSAGDLKAQRDAEREKLVSGLSETEAGLQETKSNAAVQRAQAQGQNYQEARQARAPYLARIQKLINRIDSLGATPTFTPKAAAYKAPELASYDYNRYATPSLGSGVDPNLASGAGAYWTLLAGKKKEQQPV